jgi:hypothetical protein
MGDAATLVGVPVEFHKVWETIAAAPPIELYVGPNKAIYVTERATDVLTYGALFAPAMSRGNMGGNCRLWYVTVALIF